MSLISIGKAAKMFGVHTDTLRNWERQGKIKSVRTQGNHRRYDSTQIESLVSGLRWIRFYDSISDPMKCKELYDRLCSVAGSVECAEMYADRAEISNEVERLRFIVVATNWNINSAGI